jgi:hypothetical protein
VTRIARIQIQILSRLFDVLIRNSRSVIFSMCSRMEIRVSTMMVKEDKSSKEN